MYGGKDVIMLDCSRSNAFSRDECVLVVIETSRGIRSKFKLDTRSGAFAYSRPQALGLSYTFDWGFVPSTCGEDGDPLDGIVLHDGSSYSGTIISFHSPGVLKR